MGTTYFKRFRMEIDLSRVRPPAVRLPLDYAWVAWHADLIDRHALAKYNSFRDELDSQVFTCFSDFSNCQRLMQEIAGRDTFLPEATWLLNFRPYSAERASGKMGAYQAQDCGTIQGVLQPDGVGAIQNVGITPEHRGQGLGRALVLKSLAGFWAEGVRFVYLDVTARNQQAVNLYHSLGFRLTQTSYKVVHTADAFA